MGSHLLPARPQGDGFPARLDGRHPFPTAVPPGEAVHHQNWQAAWREALSALRRRGTVLLLGDSGTGKTLFLRALNASLAAEGRRVALVQRQGSGAAAGKLDVRPEGSTDIILIDDADRVPGTLLAALVASGRPLLLAGQPALRNRIGTLPADAAVVTLHPLTQPMTAQFLARQLEAAGMSPALFHRDAVASLWRHSGGVPRPLQALAGLSLFVAQLEGAPAVLPGHVASAVAAQSGTADQDDEEEEDAGDGPGPVSAGNGEPGKAGAAEVWPSPAPPSRRFRGRRAGLSAAVLGLAAATGLALLWLDAAPGGDGGRSTAALVPTREGGAVAPGPTGILPGATEPTRPDNTPQDAEAAPSLPTPTEEARTQGAPVQGAPVQDTREARAPQPDAPVQAEAAATSPPPVAPPDLPPPEPVMPVGNTGTLPAGLPATVLPRVTVMVGQGTAAEQRGAALVRSLRERSMAAVLVSAGSAAAVPATTFFYAEDAPAAAAVAREAGLPAEQAPVRAGGPQPDPGSIHVAIPASPASRPSRNNR